MDLINSRPDLRLFSMAVSFNADLCAVKPRYPFYIFWKIVLTTATTGRSTPTADSEWPSTR